MKILIAPNSFKGSLDAFKVAQSIRQGLQKSKLIADYQLLPIADGGDHTLEVFHSWLGGSLQTSNVTGPMGKEVKAVWLLMKDSKTAVIEIAKASGIGLIEKSALNPLEATSFGTGQLIRNAIESGVKKIILGLGGSGTVDGGLGMLQALGAKLIDKKGKCIGSGTNPLMDLYDISMDKIYPGMHDIEFLILCDVDNPLLGKKGAAHVFGPQKGASPEVVKKLELSMERFNAIIEKKTGHDLSAMKGAGAAGGIAVSLKAFFNASLVSGVDFLLEQMGFEEHIKDANLLITAEGNLDSQTLLGKGPFGVATKAIKYGVPAIVLTGKAADLDLLNHGFSAIFTITNGPMTLDEAMIRTAKDLEYTAQQIGNLLASYGKITSSTQPKNA